MLTNKRIAFIGSGAMGEAMIKGMLSRKLLPPEQIIASDPVAAQREKVAGQFGVATTDDNLTAVRNADIVVLSIKPQVLGKVSAQLQGHIPADSLVLSIIAGAPIHALQQGLGHQRIVRTMPNTPAQVGKGITVWMATPAVSPEQREQARAILEALGEQIVVEDEHYLDMATGLNGSGPGFVLLLLEALIDAGVHIGFSRPDAQKIVLETVEGTVAMVRATGLHPAELKNRVTSPAGTTAAGLFELEAAGVRAALVRAVEAAYRRSQELGAIYSQRGEN
ncbi:MAG TPA: pyrroline-5-carboxylate reductase [Caldilineaceae bacterium]|nr:pyrroline-5-carboxylate reductase [Caldilineaceae bacterium]